MHAMTPSTGIEQDPVSKPDTSPFPSENSGSVWEIPGTCFRFTQVCFADGTDLVNELVNEREWLLHPQERLRLEGNLFCLESCLEKSGSWFVLEAPLPHARSGRGEGDRFDCEVSLSEDRVRIRFYPVEGAEWTRLEWKGGLRERTRVLHDWQQAKRPYHRNHRLPLFLTNTWGDRSRDSRMNEAFMLREIEAASEMGADVVQLDDGWQKGITSNSTLADQGGVWEGFWNKDPEFWRVHPQRFPNGLTPLAELAQRRGLRLGLWFAPDSWRDFTHWERDAERVLELHRAYGICFFKLDGIKAYSVAACRNLRAFVDRVLDGSGGAVVFDLDITAETRPGYWGLLPCGPLFVENRYSDWHRYWPHHTFRSLWKLSRYVNPLRLRMEFLNPDRNQHLYPQDPLAPGAYAADTLFASVMAGNPLGWFECSGLSDEARGRIREIVEVWKTHRDAFFEGTVLQAGPCPDGCTISGFLSVPATSSGVGYLLLLRGVTGQDTLSVPFPEAVSGSVSVLHGEGRAEISGGNVICRIRHERSHLFVRVAQSA